MTDQMLKQIYAWIHDVWKSAWDVDPEESAPDAALFLRADTAISHTEADAMVAAAYSAASGMCHTWYDAAIRASQETSG